MKELTCLTVGAVIDRALFLEMWQTFKKRRAVIDRAYSKIVFPFVTILLLTLPAAAQDGLRIEDVERMALEKNPTLVQSAAAIRAAEGRARQAGFYPNPVVGITGDEVSFGDVIRGGEWGVFVEQTIVLGRKLGLSRNVAEQEVVKAQAEAEAQRLRVANTVRALFYRTLAAQRKVAVREQLLALVREAVTTTRQLQNVGQADQPDLLQIEIEEHSADLALIFANNARRQLWTQLAAAVGDPALPMQMLVGDLEAIPQLNEEQVTSTILTGSPEIRVATADVSRAELSIRSAQAQRIPDLDIRGGAHYNRELLETGGRPIGAQGSIEVGIRLPLFDRNQGNVDAARADLERSQREVERVSLSLRSRSAVAFREYEDARLIVTKYRDEILPRARRAYDLYIAGFRQMAAAYPQALIAQRTFLQLQDEYDEALANVWARAVDIQGLLLEGGLSTSD